MPWAIEDKIHNHNVASSSLSLERQKTCTESKRLAHGSCEFTLLNLSNDATSKNIRYSLKAENGFISQYLTNALLEEETHFAAYFPIVIAQTMTDAQRMRAAM